jgi:hypothetical protein
MKTLVCVVAVAVAAFVGCKNDFTPAGRGGSGASEQLVIRAHFSGANELLKDPNGKQLKDLWSLKSSIDFRNKALEQFARLPFLWLSNSLPKGAADQAALFRPLLNDALLHESFFEWRAAPTISLAARLPEARAKEWDTALRQALSNWKLGAPAPFERDGRKGWEVSKGGVPAIRFSRAGEWVSFTVGHQAALLESNVLARLSGNKRTGAWLEGDANLAQFKGRLSVLDKFENLPLAHFSFSNRSETVRSFVQFDFSKPHNWKPEPWLIPTNVIWDPLADFTVARGVADVLGALPFFSDLGWKPTPSQITGWGNRDLPFQLLYAAPTRDVTNQLRKIEPQVRAGLAKIGGTRLLGRVTWDTNHSEIAWRGLPLAAPTLSATTNTATPFVALKFFPMIKTETPPPRELFEQFLGREDLVLYDWEATRYRIPTWRQMYQLAEIATGRRLSSTNAPGERWPTEIAPLLQDSVTELRATSPTQMTLVRKSTLGVTAVELVTLSRWIESSSFPSFGVFPLQPPKSASPAGTTSPKNR